MDSSRSSSDVEMSNDEMDTQDEGDRRDGDEEMTEEMTERQPDFSAQEIDVQVEEVTVTEVEEVTETLEISMVEENTNDQEDVDFPDPGTIAGHSYAEGKELDALKEEPGADTQLIPESGPSLQVAKEDMDALDPAGADDAGGHLNRTVGRQRSKLVRERDSETVIEGEVTEVVADLEVTEDAVEDGAYLQGAALHGHNENVIEENSDHFPTTPGNEQVTNDRGMGGQHASVPPTGNGDANPEENHLHGGIETSFGVQGHEASASQCKPGLKLNTSIADGLEPNREGSSPDGGEHIEPIDSAQIPPTSAQADLGSASTSVSLFTDAMQAQLRAQIYVLSAFRQGKKPNKGIMATACPKNVEGSAEPLLPEMGNLKNSDTQAQQTGTDPSGYLGIASDDAVAVEPNQNLAHQNASQAADSELQDETDRQLELAQSTAQDAMATATSALAQSHMAWARIQSHNPSEAGTTREAQIASVAATVAAAASVAKAAVEAAKAIAEISIDALMQAGSYGGTQLRLRSGHDLFQTANGNESTPRGKTRKKTASHQKAGMLDAVVQAAGMAAEAAAQAGAVLAKANPLMQATGMEGFWAKSAHIEEPEDRTQGIGSKKGKTSISKRTEGTFKRFKGQRGASLAAASTKLSKGVRHRKESFAGKGKQTPEKEKEALGKKDALGKKEPSVKKESSRKKEASGKREASRKKEAPAKKDASGRNEGSGKEEASGKGTSGKKDASGKEDASGKDTSGKKDASGKEDTSGKKGAVGRKQKVAIQQKESNVPSGKRKSVEPHRNANEPPAITDTNNRSESMAVESVVEVMSADEGLRGGWFIGKALKVTKSDAYVMYDELLTDDGASNLCEWFPYKAIEIGPGARRQVRPVHPYSLAKEAGSKKRRRVALGSQTWNEGDRVDAFVQDGWWEGVIVELNDLDESKVTVYFPGENDTQVIKSWDLRPSLQWTDNKWMPMSESPEIENEQPKKRQKLAGSSSNMKKDKPEKVSDLEPTGNHKKDKREKLSHKRDKPEKGTDLEPTTNEKKTRSAKKSSSELIGEVVEPTPVRTTRNSKDKTSTQNISTASQKKSTEKKSTEKKSNRNKTETKILESQSQAHQKDVVPPGTPKKLNFDVGKVTSTKPAKIVDKPVVNTPATRGKRRAENEDSRRQTRKASTVKV